MTDILQEECQWLAGIQTMLLLSESIHGAQAKVVRYAAVRNTLTASSSCETEKKRKKKTKGKQNKGWKQPDSASEAGLLSNSPRFSKPQ
jgi:hypothetical protein